MASKRTVAVGVKIGELDDEGEFKGHIEWHAPSAGHGDYATLCSIDPDDPAIGHHGTVEAKPGQKITCNECKSLWHGVMSLNLRATDFE